MRVKVYYNLHRKVWSVLAKNEAGQWRLFEHMDFVVLTDCEFKVSEAGRQRVIREQRKNVHAFVIGTLVEGVPASFMGTLRKITYNPYKYSTFVCVDNGQPIHRAYCAVLAGRNVEAMFEESDDVGTSTVSVDRDSCVVSRPESSC